MTARRLLGVLVLFGGLAASTAASAGAEEPAAGTAAPPVPAEVEPIPPPAEDPPPTDDAVPPVEDPVATGPFAPTDGPAMPAEQPPATSPGVIAVAGGDAPPQPTADSEAAPAMREPAQPRRAKRAVDPAEVCADALNPTRCGLAVASLNTACASQPDPTACEQAVRAHACVLAPVSIECLAYLTTRPCIDLGRESFECATWSGLRSVYCSRTSGDPDCLPPICCFAEPVRPDLPGPGGQTTLASDRGDPLGIPDPGALGDRGLAATAPPDGGRSRPRTRAQLPFTGGPLLPLLIVGLGALAAGGAAGGVPRGLPLPDHD